MNSSHRLKVAHLTDQPCGGAAVAAKRLVQGLSRFHDMEIEQWFFGKTSVSHNSVNRIGLEADLPKTVLERIVRLGSRKSSEKLRRRRQRRALLSAVATRKPDILHLHNLHASALRHEDLALIPRQIKLVWTMHDCWPWAPYAYRWKSNEGTDEFQGREMPASTDGSSKRRDFFAKRPDVVLVSPSRWLAQEAADNTDAIRVEVIPNGIPTDVFRPRGKTEAKLAVGLTPSKIWMGLSAASFDRRKGADIFVEALRLLRHDKLGVVLWGRGDHINFPESIEVFSAAFVADEDRQALLYSACDLYVCPSRIDNFPNTISESMACGTPVVASSAGGIREMVCPGKTGWLYAPNTPEACATCLGEALQYRDKWNAYGQKCRETVGSELELYMQAERHRSVYLEMFGMDSRISN